MKITQKKTINDQIITHKKKLFWNIIYYINYEELYKEEIEEGDRDQIEFLEKLKFKIEAIRFYMQYLEEIIYY